MLIESVLTRDKLHTDEFVSTEKGFLEAFEAAFTVETPYPPFLLVLTKHGRMQCS